MFLSKLKILHSHGRQYIPDLDNVELSPLFRGRIRIKSEPTIQEKVSLAELCPSEAICTTEFAIDMGRCMFCNECVPRFPHILEFSPDYHTAVTRREDLMVNWACNSGIRFDADSVRPEVRRTFGHALKLRQVSAGGDNSNEMELNASMNVNFDFSRYGVEFVASPRHADGVVITGPITTNMAIPLELCYNSISDPKVVILCGTDAISGGIFAPEALDRSFLDRFHVDLYVPGNPVHPLAFIDGVMQLCGRKISRLNNK